jgi:hypothetical protein
MNSSNCWTEADEIEKAGLSGHGNRVTLRSFFAIFIAAAMLFAPFAMQSAMAAAPANHHAQMQANDHCDGQPAQDQDNKSSTDKPCCAAMCIAVAIEPASVIEPLEFEQAAERPAVAESPHSYLARLPTPPPRAA